MNIKSLAHVCVKTTDLQQTAGFLVWRLGNAEAFDFTQKGEVIGFYLKASNDTFFEVFRTGDTEPITGGQILSHFCFKTDSIEKLRQTLVNQGYAPGEIIMGADNALQFWIQDPNGLNIEFQQYTEHSSQLTGKNVEVN